MRRYGWADVLKVVNVAEDIARICNEDMSRQWTDNEAELDMTCFSLLS